MSTDLEQELTEALVDGYERAGHEVGYWGRRFLAALRRSGGLATARRMMKPRTAGQRAGLDALLEADRPDLTLEAIILQPKFRKLFTEVELSVAAERLGEFGRSAVAIRASRERLYPDELQAGHRYIEGARKQVRVNAYRGKPQPNLNSAPPRRSRRADADGPIACRCPLPPEGPEPWT